MVATRQISVEEFASTPREGHWELIDGEPFEVSPASFHSVWIAGEIYSWIREFVRGQDFGWVVADGAGFILFEDRSVVRSPDVAFVRKDRMPSLIKGFVPLAPDLAVEVLSPSDRMADALSKVAMYLEAGVRLVWLVDPERQTVTIFQPDGGIAIAHGDAHLDGGDVMPGLNIPLALIFPKE